VGRRLVQRQDTLDEQRALRGFSALHADDQWLLALRLFERLPYADLARGHRPSRSNSVARAPGARARNAGPGVQRSEERAA
jgi:hypothetical protein